MNDLIFEPLEKLGIDINTIKSYDILCLPDNLDSATSKDDLFDADNSMDIYKYLKNTNVKCANSVDLGLNAGVVERRSKDIWLGVIWVLNHVALPILINTLSEYLKPYIINISDLPMVPKKQQSTIHLDLKILKTDKFTSLKYKGDPQTLNKVLKSLNND